MFVLKITLRFNLNHDYTQIRVSLIPIKNLVTCSVKTNNCDKHNHGITKIVHAKHYCRTLRKVIQFHTTVIPSPTTVKIKLYGRLNQNTPVKGIVGLARYLTDTL